MLVSRKVQPTPVWVLWRHETPVPLLVPADRKLPPADLRAVVGPDRHPLRSAAGGLPRVVIERTTGEKSSSIRERVVHARRTQSERFRKSANATNSSMNPRQMKAHCQIDSESTGYLEHAMEEMNFSARAHDRILKVARTLADLSGSPEIRAADILEAIQYRSLDRKLFS
jgi:hypothetical protein